VKAMTPTIDKLTERDIAETIEASGRWLAGASPRTSVSDRPLSVEVGYA